MASRVCEGGRAAEGQVTSRLTLTASAALAGLTLRAA